MSDLSRLLDDVYDPDAGGRFTAGEVTASPPPGDSPEAAARRAFDWRADEHLDENYNDWVDGPQAADAEPALQSTVPTSTMPAYPPVAAAPSPATAPYDAPAVSASPVTPAPAPDPAYPPVPPASTSTFREAVQWPTEPLSPPEAELASQQPAAPAWYPADDDIIPSRSVRRRFSRH